MYCRNSIRGGSSKCRFFIQWSTLVPTSFAFHIEYPKPENVKTMYNDGSTKNSVHTRN